MTIAVLPFEDASGGMADEHLADGFTEGLIAALGGAASDRIRVIARTSSMAYRRVRRTAQEIGRELGADYLVGTVHQQDQRLRIAATLVRARDHVQLWSEVYDRSPADLATLERELAATIASEAGFAVRSATRSTIDTLTHDPDAQDLLSARTLVLASSECGRDGPRRAVLSGSARVGTPRMRRLTRRWHAPISCRS